MHAASLATRSALCDLQRRIDPIRRRIVEHALYPRLREPWALRVFMEHHVYAVLDFMSLLKALQRRLTCLETVWIPPADRQAARLVNQIVLGEESDEIPGLGPLSHFELYLEAMGECGADTGPVRALVAGLGAGRDWRAAAGDAGVPAAARDFLATTMQEVETAPDHALAAGFVFGREGLIPAMFRNLVAELHRSRQADLGWMIVYLDRHIQVDSEEHGPAAERLVEHLCGDDPARWADAEAAARRALSARLALWDAIEAGLFGTRT